jgi:hypothetical protein
MLPQHGILIINLVLYIICTIPITATSSNHIHHSSSPLSYLTTDGGISHTRRSTKTNNGKKKKRKKNVKCFEPCKQKTEEFSRYNFHHVMKIFFPFSSHS